MDGTPASILVARVRRPLPPAGAAWRKEKGTDRRRTRGGFIARLADSAGVFAIPLAQLVPGSGFDVALTVERAAPPVDRTPGLAFTGAPLLVLIAVLSVLVAAGLNVLASARRREAEGRGGGP